MKTKRPFAYVPGLPNQGSPHQTPASLMLDVKYASLLLVERWTYDRYVRLCQFLEFTPYELASLVMLSHTAVDSFKAKNIMCFHNARQTALLLTLVEWNLCKNWTDDVIDPFQGIADLENTFAL